MSPGSTATIIQRNFPDAWSRIELPRPAYPVSTMPPDELPAPAPWRPGVAPVSKPPIPATPQELTQHACFSHLLRDGGVWRLADRHGKEVEVPVRSRIQFNNIGCILDATRAGHGIAILPTYLCGDDLASGALVSVLDDHEPQVDFGRNLYACYLPSRSRAAKVKQFLAQLEALLTPIPPWDRYREGR